MQLWLSANDGLTRICSDIDGRISNTTHSYTNCSVNPDSNKTVLIVKYNENQDDATVAQS